MHRLTRIIDKKVAKGKMLQAVLLLVLQKLLTPTPAMGVFLGCVVTLFVAPLVILRLSEAVGPLTFGAVIVALAAGFQRYHDRYWEKPE